MINNKRILYLMSIEWGWIKQRPHFIAEGLTGKYEVVTLSKKSILQERSNCDTKVKVVYPIRLIPERLSIIKKINTFVYKLYLNYFIKRSKYIWFCSPTELSAYVLNRCTKDQVVIYDCMDDMLAFPLSSIEKEQVRERESRLIERANHIFCSANHLRNIIKERYSIVKDITLLNNALTIDEEGYASKDDTEKHITEFFASKAFKITYIGTVSEWFDFKLINQVINTVPNTEVHIFGPCSEKIRGLYLDSRIIYHGAVDHKYVKAIMQGSSVLIMPFVVTELIESVNPVKLYEYIYSGCPCLAPYYGESLQFGQYCFLYKNHEEAISYLLKISSGELSNKQPVDSCMRFAKSNTWEERANVIMGVLTDI